MSDIALCIPRISVNFTKNYINEKIRKLNWGFIENINEIPLLKEKDFKRIVIKFFIHIFKIRWWEFKCY